MQTLVEKLQAVIDVLIKIGENDCADLSRAQGALLHHATQMLQTLADDVPVDNPKTLANRWGTWRGSMTMRTCIHGAGWWLSRSDADEPTHDR